MTLEVYTNMIVDQKPLTIEELIKNIDEFETRIIATMDQAMVANVRGWYPNAKLKHFLLMERICNSRDYFLTKVK